MSRASSLLLLSLLPFVAAAGEAFKNGVGEPSYSGARFGQGISCAPYSCNASLIGPGYIHRNSGTVELWVKMEKDLRPYLNYRTLFMLPPAREQKGFTNQFGIIFTPNLPAEGRGEGDLVFTMKTLDKSYSATARGLDWKEGSDHYVAASWGASGMKLFIDGSMAAENDFTGGLFSESPSTISIGDQPSHTTTSDVCIDELKISNTQRPAGYFASAWESGQAPQLDANTLALCHFDGSMAIESFAFARQAEIPQAALLLPGLAGKRFSDCNVFLPEEEPSLDCSVLKGAKALGQLSLSVTAKDFRGKDTGKAEMAIPLFASGESSSNLTIPLPVKGKRGWHSISLELREDGKVISKQLTSCIVIDQLQNHAYKLGIDCYSPSSIPWKAFDKCGFRMARMHMPWRWSTIGHAGKGGFDFRISDATLAAADENGIAILAVLGYTPVWAAVPPDNIEDFKGGKNEKQMLRERERWRSRSLDEYREYVRATAMRYSGRIKYWEHYNEPDWHLPQTPGFAYGGTTEQFAEQMRINSEEIRKADPAATIVFPGIACAELADKNFVRDIIALGGMKCFDLLGMHNYGGNNFFQSQIELFRKAGYKGPVWQTERYAASDIATDSIDAYYLQLPDIIEMMAMGVELYIVHDAGRLFCAPADLRPYASGSPQPEAFTIAFLYRMVGAKRHVGMIPGAKVHFFSDGQENMAVCWGAGDINLQTGAAKLIVTDIFGEAKAVETENGVISFKASKEPHYITAAPGGKLDFSRFALAAPAKLLGNPGFEDFEGDAGLSATLPREWSTSSGNNSGKSELDRRFTKEGALSLRIEAPQGKDMKHCVVQSVKLVPGHSYELSGWLRTEGAGSVRKASVSIWSRSLLKVVGEIVDSGSDSEFRFHSIKFTVPEGSADNAISCCGYAGAGNVWFDALQLREIMQ